MIPSLFRFYIFWIYIPLRRASHALRDRGRRLRTVVGLREPNPSEEGELTLPEIPWHRVCRPTGVLFRETKKVDGNVNLAEQGVLNALCRTMGPERIMEIGTFDGRTTLNLALNSNAQVFTLDLPMDQEPRLQVTGVNRRYIDKPLSGARFLSPPNNRLPCVERITRLQGDSATFDFSPWYGNVDFVFVDGAHDYDYVVNDARVARKLLRPEGGVIVFHDYGNWEGVNDALHALRDEMAPGSLVHIKDTSLAAAFFGRARRGP
jgi:hypothetical protein